MKPAAATLLALVLAGGASPAFGARFSSEFVEFDLPAAWSCELEGEWVCRTTLSTAQKDAIIVLTAKAKGAEDAMDRYQNRLKRSKHHVKDGKKIESNPLYTKTVRINEQEWIDSLHGDSEIGGYYTRYLATVKDELGILVTYSIHKKLYQRYVKDFEAMIASLKTFRPAPPPVQAAAEPPPTDYTKMVPTTFQGGGKMFEGLGEETKSRADAPMAPVRSKDNDLYLIGGAVAAVVLLILRKRRQG